MKEVIKYMAAQLSKVAMVTAIVAGVLVPAMAVNAQDPGICTFGGHFERSIVVNGNTATATFVIPNGVNNSCKRDGALQYSLAVYTAPDASLRPLSSQKLYSSSTHKFLPGSRTLTAQVPSCGFYQIDLAKGPVIANLDDAGNSYAPKGRLITAIGGGSACPQPEAPAQAAADINIVDNSVNNSNNTNINQQQQQGGSGTQSQAITTANGTTVAQSQSMTAQTQTQTQTQKQNPVSNEVVSEPVVGKELPQTGPADALAVALGVGIASTVAFNLVARRRASQIA